jgi:hypothetical protein
VPKNSDQTSRLTRTQRFDRWIRGNALILILALVAFLITTAIAVTGPITSAIHWYHHSHQWRQREYEKLTALRAGFTIQRFEEVLGEPVFRQQSRDRKWEENTFEGRDYWVQAVADRVTGSVALYAATSCSRSFNPSFVLADGTTIKLNHDTLGTIHGNLGFGSRAEYFAPLATADAHFIDIAYGGNPSNYKTYAWGFNDACVNLPGWESYLPNTDWPLGSDDAYHGPAGGGGPEIQAFRRRIPINTYAETSPTTGYDFFRHPATTYRDFQIGVDRILIRTVLRPSYGPSKLLSKTKLPPRPPIRRAYGSAPLQRAWRCLHRRKPASVLLFDKRNYTEDANQRPVQPIFRARGGFIIVNGFIYPVSAIAGREVRAWLGFESRPARAEAVAGLLRRKYGENVSRVGTVVVLWTPKTASRERRLVTACL